MRKVKTGIIGCGKISDIYLKNCTGSFKVLDVAACADIINERAQQKANEYAIPKVCTVQELLDDPEIEIVLDLTVPMAHGSVAIEALKAGKNIYNEKPLAITREDGLQMLKLAGDKRLLVGCAPDTFLGGGLQTCRKLIDDGWIGEPVAATAFMMGHGPESWHPNPDFFYKTGGGPMFDMGPYYLTALISLIGPVKKAACIAGISFPERTITNPNMRFGEKIKVEVPTHVAGVLEFKNGAIGSIITSFDVWGGQLPRIEIYGSKGTLTVPDPNTFGGQVFIKRQGWTEWKEVPLTHGFIENSRGIGVADMAYSIISGRKNRANGNTAYHVLDIMHALHESSTEGRHVEISSSCERPEPLPMGNSTEILE